MSNNKKIACCRYCGEKILNTDSMCKHCGSELSEFDIIYKEEKKIHVGKVLAILSAVICIFICIFVFGYFLLFTGESVFHGEHYELSYEKNTWLHLGSSEDSVAFYYVGDKMSSSFLIIDEFYEKSIDLSTDKKREEFYLGFQDVLSSSNDMELKGGSNSFLPLHDTVYYAEYTYEQSDISGNFYFLVDQNSKKIILFKTFTGDDVEKFNKDFMVLLNEINFLDN